MQELHDRIKCRVRNMPPVGTCLAVTSQVGISDYVVLVISYAKLSRPCHVFWRSETRVGVAFRVAQAQGMSRT